MYGQHDLAIAALQSCAQSLFQVPSIDGAEGLRTISEGGNDGDRTRYFSARNHPPEKFQWHARHIDGEKQIQLCIGSRKRRLDAGKRAGTRVVVRNHGSEARKIRARAADTRTEVQATERLDGAQHQGTFPYRQERLVASHARAESAGQYEAIHDTIFAGPFR